MPNEVTKEVLEKVNETLKETHETTLDKVKELLANGKKESDEIIVAMKDNIEKTDAAIDSIQQQIKQLSSASVPGAEKELENFSLQAFCKGIYESTSPTCKSISEEKAWEGCEMEKEVYDAYIKERANYASDGSAGAYIAPPEVSSKIIGLVYASIPLLDQLPVTKLTGIRGGEYHIPKLTSGATAYMVGERQEPTLTEVAYGEIIARERRVAALSLQSKRLMYQSRGVSDEIIRRELVRAMSLKIHQMLYNGKGAEYEPKGLTRYSGDFTTNTINLGDDGGRFTITDAALMQMVIEAANEGNDNPKNYGFLMRPEVKFGMKTERVRQYAAQNLDEGQPVLPLYGILPDAVLKEIIGNLATTSQMENDLTKGEGDSLSNVIYGNWSFFWMLMWEGMEIRVSDQAYVGGTSTFSQNQIAIIAEQGFDCAVTREAAFTMVNHAETDASNW